MELEFSTTLKVPQQVWTAYLQAFLYVSEQTLNLLCRAFGSVKPTILIHTVDRKELRDKRNSEAQAGEQLQV